MAKENLQTTTKEETNTNETSDHSHSEAEDPDNLQIVINRVRAVTIKAPLTIQGTFTKGIIDTSAEVTVLSKRLYNLIPKDLKPPLQKARRGLVVAEAGREMKTCGIAEVEFSIGDYSFIWPVYVAPIRDDLLLGCDLLDEMNITVNTKRGIQIEDKWIDCEVIRSHDSTAQVKVARAVTIPANSEFVMRGHCNSAIAQNSNTFIFEAAEEAQEKILIARSVTQPISNKIPVKMINHRSTPVKLKKGLILGTLQPVGSLMETGQSFSIADHKEGLSICRLNMHNKHNEETSSFTTREASLNVESKESCSSKTRETNEVCAMEDDMPTHLQELFKTSSGTLEPEQKLKLKALLLKYQDAFAKSKTELGKCSVLKHRIDTAESAPVRQPLRRTPQGFEGEEDKYIREQLAAGSIQPSTSAWSSPLVLVRKKTGEVRVCVDYRKLNERTIKDAYPLPRIDMCIDCLSSAKIYSTIDLQSVYMQLEVAEEDRHKTAFITKYGLYEYSVMPYGLCNGPSTFQRCIELIFRGIQWEYLLVYLDDIIVIATDFDEHIQRLDEVFKRISMAGLKMKSSKCELFKSEVLFLGHVVSQDGIRPNPKTIEAVMSWREPTSVKEIQRFIGLCSYYRQYIQSFSHIAAPMLKLTKKNAKFMWDESCRSAFETLKKMLCS